MIDLHERYLDLAIAAIDFPLDPREQAELDRHLAGCHACRRYSMAIHADARGLDELPRLAIPPMRAERIRRNVVRGRRSETTPVRILAIAAVLTVGGVAAVATGSRLFSDDQTGPTPQPSIDVPSTNGPAPSGPLSVLPTPSAPPSAPSTTSQPTTSAPPGPPGVSTDVPLPIVGASLDGFSQPEPIGLVAGADGVLHVTIPGPDGMTLVLIERDGSGSPLPGWPIRLDGLDLCSRLLPVEDDSVRIVCSNPIGGHIAHAFDRSGRALPGWPVTLDGELQLWAEHRQPRVVGGDLVAIPIEAIAPPDSGDEPDRIETWITRVDSAGSVATGTRVAYPCCGAEPGPVLGPDATGYIVTATGSDTDLTTQLTAFDMAGERAGWPLFVAGQASAPAFDAAGRLYVAVGAPVAGPTHVLVFDGDGQELARSDSLPIASTSRWQGAGEWIAPPIVAPDGTAFVVQSGTGITAYRIDPDGRTLQGWPYQETLDLQDLGRCTGQDTGCGYWRSAPAAGPDGTLYLLRGPATPGGGGSVAAIGLEGSMVESWPVSLQRAGSAFHLVTVGADGTVYVLAMEPEPTGTSATIVALGQDSNVVYRTTIVEP